MYLVRVPVPAVFGLLQRLLPPTTCRNPPRFKSRHHFRIRNYPNMEPQFRMEAVPKIAYEKIGLKNYHFRVHKVDHSLYGSKRLVLGFSKRSIRVGLRAKSARFNKNKKRFINSFFVKNGPCNTAVQQKLQNRTDKYHSALSYKRYAYM